MSSSFTATDVQKAKLEKLMQNIDKPIEIPQRPKESRFAEPPDFIRNIMGSSAGAGSGEFHVYRHLRRKEYARQRFIEEQARQEELDRKFNEAVEEKKRKVDEKTAKKRAKRLRKKEKLKQARKAKKPKPGHAKEASDEDTDDDEEDEEDDEKSDSKSNCERESRGETELKGDDKNELGNKSVGSAPTSSDLESMKLKEENDSDDEETIGPMPPVDKNSADRISENPTMSDNDIRSESKPRPDHLQAEKSADPSDESDDEVIGPMPTASTDQNEDEEESSDDEVIGPMPV